MNPTSRRYARLLVAALAVVTLAGAPACTTDPLVPADEANGGGVGSIIGVWSSSWMSIVIAPDSSYQASALIRNFQRCCVSPCDTPTVSLVMQGTVRYRPGGFAFEDSIEIFSPEYNLAEGLHGQFRSNLSALDAFVFVQATSGNCTITPSSISRREELRPH